jgi:uncharacterized protein (TIGR02145 family)
MHNISEGVKAIFAVIILLIIELSCGTPKQLNSRNTNTTKPNDSLLVDTDGNRYPVKRLLDGNLWMTSNLNSKIPDSYCYQDLAQNCERYGRLYTWESANKGCTLLGEQWRLPTSDEWRQLTILYGGNAEDFTLARKEAFKALLYTGGSQFNAVLGGGRASGNEYARLEAHGFYWTSTESAGNTARYYNFAKGSQALFQQDAGEKSMAISVRCVKGINTSK